MNNVFKFLIATFILSMSATSFAQCIPMNAPGPPRIWDGQRGCYVPQGTPAVGATAFAQQPTTPVFIPNQGVPISNFGANPLNAFSRCEVIGGVAGATIGSLAKNHTWQAGILGAIAGGVVGNALCTNHQGQQVTVPLQQLQTQGQQGQKSCTRFWSDGRKEKKLVSSEAECDAFITAKSENNAPSSTLAQNVQASSRASVCTRKWSNGKVEQKEGLTQSGCDDYQAGKIN